MYKKIIVPLEELQYQHDGIDNKYLLYEGNRSIGLFAFNKGFVIPPQIFSQEMCFYLLDGNIEIDVDDKNFNMKKGEMLLIPKSTSYKIALIENSKILVIRL